MGNIISLVIKNNISPFSALHIRALSNTFSITFRKTTGVMLFISSRILLFNCSMVLGLLM